MDGSGPLGVDDQGQARVDGVLDRVFSLVTKPSATIATTISAVAGRGR